tara:strand:+ start:70 stop:468 length:399 start_codon:yes stop_codon:yes gene_type:complete
MSLRLSIARKASVNRLDLIGIEESPKEEHPGFTAFLRMKLSARYMFPANARSHCGRIMVDPGKKFGVTLEVIAVIKVKVVVWSRIMMRAILRENAVPANMWNASIFRRNMSNATGYKTQPLVVSFFLGFVGQ